MKLPKGNQLLPKRGSTQEVKDTFQLRPGQEHTFKDLIEKEVELPLRLFTQQFKHGKAVCYTQPHRTVARAFSLGAKRTAGQPTWNFAQLVHRELFAYAAESQKMLTCGQVLTRVAYHAVGMVDN